MEGSEQGEVAELGTFAGVGEDDGGICFGSTVVDTRQFQVWILTTSIFLVHSAARTQGNHSNFCWLPVFKHECGSGVDGPGLRWSAVAICIVGHAFSGLPAGTRT